jgi:hypothetical protein
MYGFGWNDDAAPAEQVQPTPAPKYRVGDRVRVVKDGRKEGGSLHGANIGDITTIKTLEQTDTDTYYYFAANGWSFLGHEIAPAFRPGDRVRLNKHYGARACGERGIVSSVLGDAVCVRMDDASLWGTVTAALPASVLDWERDEGEQHATSTRAPWQDDAADCAGRKEQPKPKFRAGDVVRYKGGGGFTNGKTLRTIKGPYCTTYPGGEAYAYTDGGWDYASSLELVTAAPCPQDNEQPCIVARVETYPLAPWGSKPISQPRPSTYPHVHTSVAAATAEAERLARNNPGQEFAVYQRVAGRVAEQHIEMKEVA